jgi:hypothetical protein
VTESSARQLIRELIWLDASIGAFFVLCAVSSLAEGRTSGPIVVLLLWGMSESRAAAVIGLGFGLLLSIAAFGLWRRSSWALRAAEACEWLWVCAAIQFGVWILYGMTHVYVTAPDQWAEYRDVNIAVTATTTLLLAWWILRCVRLVRVLRSAPVVAVLAWPSAGNPDHLNDASAGG